MKLLLDTSIIIDFFRSKNKETTLFVELSREKHAFSISIITHTELFSGKSIWEKKRLCDELEEICSEFEVLTLNPLLSKKAGKIRAYHGTNIADAIIAATAIEYDCKLVTLNVKDFKNIPSLQLFE